MKALVATLVVCLSLSVFASSDVHSLSEFDGSTPILGPFNEPLPDTFFHQDYTDALLNGNNYTTYFDLAEQTHGQTTAYLINNMVDINNDIVISAVMLKERKVKNFLVRVPADDALAVDLSPLKGYDHIFIMSLGDFDVQINTPTDRGKMANFNLDVAAPTRVSIAEEKSPCTSDSFGYIRIANDPPAAPGEALCLAWIGVFTGGSQRFLRIEYPISSHNWFHTDIPPYYSCGPTVPDLFTTYSQTGRYVQWDKMVALSLDASVVAKARCIAPFSCAVAGTRTFTTWTVTAYTF